MECSAAAASVEVGYRDEVVTGAPRRTNRIVPSLCVHEADAEIRPIYERFVSERFAEVYGAQLYSFMPRLLGLHEGSGRLNAVFGLREAAREPLFLEQYLDAPVQSMVGAQVGHRVARERIVEIGNLAGATPGALRQLIPVLTAMLHSCGYHWVVFTGSARLVNGFTRLGLPLQVISRAPVDRLPALERQRWGTYYDHQPSVMLGDIRSASLRLQRLAQHPQGLDAALAAVATVGAP